MFLATTGFTVAQLALIIRISLQVYRLHHFQTQSGKNSCPPHFFQTMQSFRQKLTSADSGGGVVAAETEAEEGNESQPALPRARPDRGRSVS